MPKRSITDEEIGLIKLMLSRGMKNRDIQFYFNRQERPVNSGRITQIKDGTYGPQVPTASEADVDAFLRTFKPSAIGAVVQGSNEKAEPTAAERARSLFEQRGRTGWFLISHEDAVAECKESFCLKPEGRFADPLRSIAGLANNNGGFVFFGVKEQSDGSLEVVGLTNSTFATTDPAELNRCLAGALAPVPLFSMFTLDFDGMTVGVIHIPKHGNPPVIAIKNINSEVKEGAVYYRYVGETRIIKPAELQNIIAYREQKAVSDFARRMSRVAVGNAATLDLDTGKVEGKSGSFLIDQELVPKLQFIRTGEFHETRGAPTLKLIGEVSAASVETERTVRNNITSEAVLLNYLKDEAVEFPLQYILHSAHSARKWLPLFYYAHKYGQPLSLLVERLRSENPTYQAGLDAAIHRIMSSKSVAYHRAAGRAKSILDHLPDGDLATPTSSASVSLFSIAVQGISTENVDIAWLKTSLLAAYNMVRGSTPREKAARTHLFRATCRLDEIEYGNAARAL